MKDYFQDSSSSSSFQVCSKLFVCCTPLVRRSLEQRQMVQQREIVKRIKSIALPIARAMKYLHQHRILLRDLKPENVGFAYSIPKTCNGNKNKGSSSTVTRSSSTSSSNSNSTTSTTLRAEAATHNKDGGTVKLFDFGLAIRIPKEEEQQQEEIDQDSQYRSTTLLGTTIDNTMVRPGEIAGSFRYMAPETRLGLGTSMKSDVYSFGVLLWELC